MGETSRPENATQVAEQHDGPIGTRCVLFIRVVARVYDERMIHHRSTAFGAVLEFLDYPGQHPAVVLTDLDPDGVTRLSHVTKVMPLLVNAQSLPRSENFPATRANGQSVGDTGFEG